jgi:TonB family protein
MFSIYRRWACVGLLGFTLGGQIGQAQEAPPASPDATDANSELMTEPQLRAALSFFESLRQTPLAGRTNGAALLPSPTTRDDRGRTINDDWRDYCFSETDQADITRQFAAVSTALDAHDLDTARAQRQVLYHRLEVLGIQCKTIVDYWQELVLHPQNWTPYLTMLHDNGVEPHYAANIASLEKTLKIQVRHGLFVDAIGGSWTQIQGIRARAMERDVEDLKAKALNADFKGLYSVAADTPCQRVAAHSSGKSSPSMDYDRPQPKLTYPDESRRNLEYGAVTVALIVAPSGCPRKGFVLRSSGFERLDRLAVNYAMSMALLPAEKDGAAVEALATVPVNFTLQSP